MKTNLGKVDSKKGGLIRGKEQWKTEPTFSGTLWIQKRRLARGGVGAWGSENKQRRGKEVKQTSWGQTRRKSRNQKGQVNGVHEV